MTHADQRSPYRSRDSRYKQEGHAKPHPKAKTRTSYWHRLVKDNTRLAYWCVGRVLGSGTPSTGIDVWHSEALYALVRSARCYDPDYRTAEGQPVKFSTYATWCITNALTRLKGKEYTDRQKGTVDLDRLEDVDRIDAMVVMDQGLANLLDTERSEAAERVWGLIEKAGLIEKERAAVLMHYGEEMTFRAIAPLLGVSFERVRQWVRRAERKIREAAGVG